MTAPASTDERLRTENAELRARLEEAEETLRAIRSGEVEALIVETDHGPQVFSLISADAASNRLRGEVLSQVSDSVIAVDADQRVTYLNAAAERQYRISAGDVLGRQLSQIFTRQWPSTEAEAAMWAALREHGEWRGEILHRTHDGREFPVETSMTLLRAADGADAGMVSAIRDITERKRAEETLRESQQFTRSVLDNVFAFVGVMSLDGTLTEANRSSLEAAGIPASEVLGKKFWDCYWWSYSPKIQAQLRDACERAAGGEIVRYDVPVRMAGDTRVWIAFQVAPQRDTEGRIIHLIPSALEIAARHAAEERLRFQLDLTTTITENATIAIFMTDDKSRCTFMNPSAEAMTGFTFKEVDGGILHDFIHHHYPDGRPYPIAECPIDRALPQHLDVMSHEDVFIRKSGEYFPVLVNARPIHSEGRAVGTVIEVRDVTEEKAAAEALRLLAANLSEVDRRKDEFLATLAHELRNPLAPIRNGLQLIKLAGANGTVEQARSMMERQVTQMVRLVDDLLDVSRITRGKIELRTERVEVRAVIDAAVETSRPLIEQAGHELVVAMPDEPIFVDGDATRLAQVVSNLLTNSAKYTHRGGHIRLSVECGMQNAESKADEGTGGAVLHSTFRIPHSAFVTVSVADDGIGIPPAMLDKVFVMFAQVDRTLEKTTGGLGIGLSLVKGLVEMHGGTIEAKSEGEGKGSEFVVRLPVAVPVADGPDAANGPAEEVASSGLRRILVVDDNADAADSLGQLLEMLGNEVRTAYDGEAGVAAAATFRPDVVLMDIGMPKLNGYEACHRIREQPWAADMVLVALTGWGQEGDLRKSADAGFDHHLVKPVDPQALMKMLAELPHAARS